MLGAHHHLHVAHHLLKSLVAEADAEVGAGRLFEFVCLVKDDSAGLRQDAGIGCAASDFLLDAEIGEEEMVVHDDDVALERLAPHLGDEALFEVGAGLSEAGLGAGVHLLPELAVLRRRIELNTVAGGGRLLPLDDLVELIDLFRPESTG